MSINTHRQDNNNPSHFEFHEKTDKKPFGDSNSTNSHKKTDTNPFSDSNYTNSYEKTVTNPFSDSYYTNANEKTDTNFFSEAYSTAYQSTPQIGLTEYGAGGIHNVWIIATAVTEHHQQSSSADLWRGTSEQPCYK